MEDDAGESAVPDQSQASAKTQDGEEPETPPSSQASEAEATAIQKYIRFLKVFGGRGGPYVLVFTLFVSTAMGSTVGLIPDIMGDRYSRMRYGWEGPDCSTFDRASKPEACQSGSDDAQGAAALSSLVKNLLTLLFNSMIASWTDLNGRKGALILCFFLSAFSPAALVLTQMFDSMDPAWFFSFDTLLGVVGWLSIGFAMLSDLMEPEDRAASFGVFLGFFYVGYCLGPSLSLVMSHFFVSVAALGCYVFALLFVLVILPETIPRDVTERNQRILQQQRQQQQQTRRDYLSLIIQPIKEVSILTRTKFLLLLTGATFLCGIVFSADATLVLYYIENQLNVRDADLAAMFAFMGVFGVVIQAGLMQYLVALFGERDLLVIAFLAGTLHNFLYGVARSKALIYVALCLAQITKINFILISSVASTHVNRFEQGRIQGAIFAVTAVANAVGPEILQIVYRFTKQSFGPGTMFIFASLTCFVGAILVSQLPRDASVQETAETDGGDEDNEIGGLEEPLLQA